LGCASEAQVLLQQLLLQQPELVSVTAATDAAAAPVQMVRSIS
jgi:hypothetical protein